MAISSREALVTIAQIVIRYRDVKLPTNKQLIERVVSDVSTLLDCRGDMDTRREAVAELMRRMG